MKTKIIPFDMGQVVMTGGVNDLMVINSKFAEFVYNSLRRFTLNDWGDLCAEDKELNDLALSEDEPGRLFARYNSPGGDIYIITEWDRLYTTILFPDEY